jgi:hypothetical protein
MRTHRVSVNVLSGSLSHDESSGIRSLIGEMADSPSERLRRESKDREMANSEEAA